MFCDKDEARTVLRSLLPPVSREELDEEMDKVMAYIMASNSENSDEIIDEDDFVKAIVKVKFVSGCIAPVILLVNEQHAHLTLYALLLYNRTRTGAKQARWS